MQLKKALTSIFVASAFIFTGTAAFADTIGNTTSGLDCSLSCTGSGSNSGSICPSVCPGINNIETGPNSENNNKATVENENRVVIENNANVSDDMRFDVDTSLGCIESNTVIGDVSGGDVIGNVVVSHDLNSGSVTMNSSGNSAIVAPMNMMNAVTGPNSTNTNTATVRNESLTKITNNATYSGNYGFNVMTGGTQVGNNTSVGSISTGNVDLGLTEHVSLNKNASNIVLPSSGVTIAVPDMGNSVTGPDSTNRNTFTEQNSERTIITNNADVTNNVNANISTGGNTISNNTCVGNVSTGSVRFNVNISSVAN